MKRYNEESGFHLVIVSLLITLFLGLAGFAYFRIHAATSAKKEGVTTQTPNASTLKNLSTGVAPGAQTITNTSNACTKETPCGQPANNEDAQNCTVQDNCGAPPANNDDTTQCKITDNCGAPPASGDDCSTYKPCPPTNDNDCTIQDNCGAPPALEGN